MRRASPSLAAGSQRRPAGAGGGHGEKGHSFWSWAWAESPAFGGVLGWSCSGREGGRGRPASPGAGGKRAFGFRCGHAAAGGTVGLAWLLVLLLRSAATGPTSWVACEPPRGRRQQRPAQGFTWLPAAAGPRAAVLSAASASLPRGSGRAAWASWHLGSRQLTEAPLARDVTDTEAGLSAGSTPSFRPQHTHPFISITKIHLKKIGTGQKTVERKTTISVPHRPGRIWPARWRTAFHVRFRAEVCVTQDHRCSRVGPPCVRPAHPRVFTCQRIVSRSRDVRQVC